MVLKRITAVFVSMITLLFMAAFMVLHNVRRWVVKYYKTLIPIIIIFLIGCSTDRLSYGQKRHLTKLRLQFATLVGDVIEGRVKSWHKFSDKKKAQSTCGLERPESATAAAAELAERSIGTPEPRIVLLCSKHKLDSGETGIPSILGKESLLWSYGAGPPPSDKYGNESWQSSVKAPAGVID